MRKKAFLKIGFVCIVKRVIQWFEKTQYLSHPPTLELLTQGRFLVSSDPADKRSMFAAAGPSSEGPKWSTGVIPQIARESSCPMVEVG